MKIIGEYILASYHDFLGWLEEHLPAKPKYSTPLKWITIKQNEDAETSIAILFDPEPALKSVKRRETLHCCYSADLIGDSKFLERLKLYTR